MLDKLVFGMRKIYGGGGIKPGLVDSARAIPRETRSEMKERAGAVGTSKPRLPYPSVLLGPSLLTQMAPSHPGAAVSNSNTEPESTSIPPSAFTIRHQPTLLNQLKFAVEAPSPLLARRTAAHSTTGILQSRNGAVNRRFRRPLSLRLAAHSYRSNPQ
jgi:hypothetical protein